MRKTFWMWNAALLGGLIWGPASARAQPAASPGGAAPAPVTERLADDAGGRLTLEAVAERRKAIEGNATLPEDVRKKALALLDAAAEAVKAEAEARAAQRQSDDRIEQGPAENVALKAKLDQARAEKPATVVPVTEATTSEQLAGRLAQLKSALQGRQAQATQAQEALDARVELAKRYGEEIARAKRLLEEADKEAASPPVGETDPLLAELRRLSLKARHDAAQAQAQRWEKERLSHDVRIVRLSALRDLAQLDAVAAEREVKAYQDALERQRAKETQMALQRSREALREAMDRDPAFAQVAKENQALAGDNQTLDADVARVRNEADEAETRLRALSQEAQEVREGIAKGLKQSLARQLGKRRAELYALRKPARRAESQRLLRIAQLEESLAELEDRLGESPSVDESVARLVTNAQLAPQADRAEFTTFARKLVGERDALMRASDRLQRTLLAETLRLQSAQAEHLASALEIAGLLDRHLLWTRDAPALGPRSLATAGRALGWLLDGSRWSEAARCLGRDIAENPLTWALLLMPALALLALARRMRRTANHLAGLVRKVDTDRYVHTLRAAVIELTRGVWLPYLTTLVGWRLARAPAASSSEFTQAFAHGLTEAALPFFVLCLMSATVRSGGLADVHFRWRDEPLRVLRREAVWYTALVMPLIIVLGMYVWLENAEYYDSVGRLLFIAVMVLTAWTAYRLLHPSRGAVTDYMGKHPTGLLTRLRHLWVLLGCGLPLGSAALSALGYSYAAREIGGNRLSLTAAMILGLIFIQAMLVRWIFVEYRRLSVHKAKEMQAAKAEAQASAEQAGGETLVVKPDADLDLASVNEQTRQLLRTFTLSAAAIGLYTVWAGIFPALRILDDVRLWGVDAEQVTLLNLMVSALLIFITAMAARNLPGLLEVLVLQHLPTDAAGRYAITTLSRYAIVAGGLTGAFNAIGVGWDRVQWLIAAMGVGLGFGLQEIFANFVSGLIILFERPVRVGDVVTVGDVSGVVSQIRIRATTITTPDRLEYIIPNREFVTGSVLNWTLSDTVNRIVIKVGVAYGSDTDQTRAILESTCRSHPGVLTEPAPLVTFESFGESTLDFVVRAFIPDVSRRLVVTHELHTAINKALNAAGIEIAFPQRDFHLRTVSPRAAQVIHDAVQATGQEDKSEGDGSAEA